MDKNLLDDRPPPGRLRELLFSPRTPHLFRLWDELRALSALPQLDRWLAQKFRSEKRFGQKDRKWYSDALFAVFRLGIWAYAAERQWQLGLGKSWEDANWRALHDHQLEPEAWWSLLRAIDGSRLFLWLGLRLDRPLIGHSTFREAELLSVWERLLASADSPFSLHLIWYGIPPYFYRHWEGRSWTPEKAKRFLEHQATRPPLWLRLNKPENADTVLAELRERGFVTKRDGAAVAVQGEVGIYQLQAYQKGLIEVQDRASQRIGEAVPLARGSLIWDCCAGGGGKTVQLAARLQNSGAVYASDVRAYKLQDLRERAGRAQLANIRYWNWDGEKVPDFGKELARRQGFDTVLIDAPCSASGTWRRNPDAKLRMTEASLSGLLTIQDHLLHTAAEAVRPGGHLVYATCSWLSLENEERISHFLEQHSDFELKTSELLGCPEEDADAMFVAVLSKRALSY